MKVELSFVVLTSVLYCIDAAHFLADLSSKGGLLTGEKDLSLGLSTDHKNGGGIIGNIKTGLDAKLGGVGATYDRATKLVDDAQANVKAKLTSGVDEESVDANYNHASELVDDAREKVNAGLEAVQTEKENAKSLVGGLNVGLDSQLAANVGSLVNDKYREGSEIGASLVDNIDGLRVQGGLDKSIKAEAELDLGGVSKYGSDVAEGLKNSYIGEKEKIRSAVDKNRQLGVGLGLKVGRETPSDHDITREETSLEEDLKNRIKDRLDVGANTASEDRDVLASAGLEVSSNTNQGQSENLNIGDMVVGTLRSKVNEVEDVLKTASTHAGEMISDIGNTFKSLSSKVIPESLKANVDGGLQSGSKLGAGLEVGGGIS